MSAGDHRGACRPCVGHVFGDGRELVRCGQRTDVGAVVERAAEGQGPGAGGEGGEEVGADALVHVDPLHRHAELSGGGEARRHRACRRRVHVGVGQHDHGVLATEFEGVAGQPSGDLPGERLARRGGAGEAHVVRLLHQRVADRRAPAEHDVPRLDRQSRALGQFVQPQRRQGGLVVRLLYHGVARHQRGQHVHRGQRERVVPGRDDADDTLGVPELARPGEQGQDPGRAPGREQAGGVPAVVGGDQRRRADLVEGVDPGLARLHLHQVKALVLVGEDEFVQAQQHLLSLGDRAPGPRLLRPAGPAEHRPGVLVGALGDHGAGQPGERRRHGRRAGVRAGGHPGEQGLGPGRRGCSRHPAEGVRAIVGPRGVCRRLPSRAGHGASTKCYSRVVRSGSGAYRRYGVVKPSGARRVRCAVTARSASTRPAGPPGVAGHPRARRRARARG